MSVRKSQTGFPSPWLKVSVLTLALLSVIAATVWFHLYLRQSIVVTHLYYVPIILATLWWQRRGLWVAGFLAAFLITISFYTRGQQTFGSDLLRAGMFLSIGFVFALLSEQNEQYERKLKIRSDRLTKRVNELDCLFSLAQATEDDSLSTAEICQRVPLLIRRAWLHPKACWVRLRIYDDEFVTENFQESPWRMSAPILVKSGQVGMIEVGYRTRFPERDEGPFLREERALLNGVASRLSLFIERRQLREELLVIGDQERGRIGQDLHDGLGQVLSGIACMAHTLGEQMQDAAASGPEVARQIERHANEAIVQARLIAQGLCPVDFEHEGLMHALGGLASNVSQLHGVDCRLDCPSPVLLPDHLAASHLYRIAQEAVTNALRHGHAGKITIELLDQGDHFILGIRDNGLGFEPGRTGGEGLGLRLMRYRASQIQATLCVKSQPGAGASVECICRNNRQRRSSQQSREECNI